MFEDKILFFDFDGTIANTEMYHKIAARKALEHFGIRADISLYFGRGKSNREIFTEMQNNLKIEIPIDEIIALKTSLFKKVAVDLCPYAGMEKMVKSLPNRKFVITKNEQDIVFSFLKKWDMRKYFENIISLSSSSLTKSEMIIKTGISPENCVLFDDVFTTVINAIDNGIQGVLVENGKVKTITNEDWMDNLAWDVKAYWLAGICNKAAMESEDNKMVKMEFWKDWLDSEYDGSARKMRF